eukprot:Gregarina_sp_Poly_1__3641@NODE_2072_length_2736_cov_20_069689_g1336_i0_p3_GENE_NODE_2072_length_2736_cov_20_069689_g1336_i0NODE_2072_length_2736_cov_20_069689_g1336_i0_p3_ORF_typecomplete_len127_score16_76Hydrolase_4/PF12146_8/0_00069UvdE/PF03851_14/0_0036Peptidase_S9/PF00326_21/0_0078PB1/PF00564_24/0_021DUF2920/PF11144_8/0_011Abhydrolase_2/PF02230_16/0_03DLH/PF01738_18/0_059PHB_depo_C/PF06850_11/0_046NTFlike/PF14540_6/0_19NTFlike/PF14540_6/87FSH1/PF03959_13/0_19_NODE_2072_length_2736_cov_20_069
MGADILQKVLFKPISSRMINWLIHDDVDWDNAAEISQLFQNIRRRHEEMKPDIAFHDLKLVVIHGEDDEVVSIKQCDELLKAIEAARAQNSLPLDISGIRVSCSGHCDIVAQQHVLKKVFDNLYGQ